MKSKQTQNNYESIDLYRSLFIKLENKIGKRQEKKIAVDMQKISKYILETFRLE